MSFERSVSPVSASVIICAYTQERLKDIHEAVQSVLDQTLRPHQVLVAVDHNRALSEILRAELPAHVEIVLNEGARGLSETRNTGIRASTGSVVAFIDDDAVAEATWLERLAGHYDNPRVAAVGGKAVPAWLDGGRPAWFPEELDWVIGCTYKGLPVHGSEVRNVIGCNMSFRTECFNAAGFFSTRVGRNGKINGAGEEAEMCQRIRQAMPASAIVYEPGAIIRHKVPSWRMGPRYLVRRSYDEGLCKTIVKRLSSRSSSRVLSVENTYLRYLLLSAVPGRLKEFYRPQAVAQVGAIALATCATGAGYIQGSIRQ